MARTKVTALLITALSFMALTTGLDFQVDIQGEPEVTERNLQYQENVSSVQNVNMSLENTGSIGCSYRAMTSYSYGNNSFAAYSPPYAIWPGASEPAEIYFAPLNYTGPVNATVNVDFCGETREVAFFNFSVTENSSRGENISSETVAVSEKQAEVKIDVEEGLLVPQDAPSYWKVSSTDVRNSTANLEYEAPIFDEDRTITYAVVQKDSVTGFTEVELKSSSSLLDRLLSIDQKVLYTVILAIMVANTGLFLRNRN